MCIPLPYELRALNEHAELTVRFTKLGAFLKMVGSQWSSHPSISVKLQHRTKANHPRNIPLNTEEKKHDHAS